MIFPLRGRPVGTEHATIGDTGATVSRLALGCMGFGSEHETALERLDDDLSESDAEWLEEPYEPVRVSGHE